MLWTDKNSIKNSHMTNDTIDADSSETLDIHGTRLIN